MAIPLDKIEQFQSEYNSLMEKFALEIEAYPHTKNESQSQLIRVERELMPILIFNWQKEKGFLIGASDRFSMHSNLLYRLNEFTLLRLCERMFEVLNYLISFGIKSYSDFNVRAEVTTEREVKIHYERANIKFKVKCNQCKDKSDFMLQVYILEQKERKILFAHLSKDINIGTLQYDITKDIDNLDNFVTSVQLINERILYNKFQL